MKIKMQTKEWMGLITRVSVKERMQKNGSEMDYIYIRVEAKITQFPFYTPE